MLFAMGLHLCSMLIADEDHLAASVLYLLKVRCRVSDIDDAAQCPEVVDGWLLPMPSLEWSQCNNTFRWAPIQHIYSSTHCFAPEPPRQPFRLEHASRRSHHHVVLVFHHVQHDVLVMDCFHHAILGELHGGEFTTMVGAECP